MISKFKFNVAVMLVLAFVVFAGAALAQDTTTTPNQDNTQKQDKFQRRGKFGRGGDREFRGNRGPEGMLRMFRDLNLTDAQKAQIKSILDANKPDQATLDQMKSMREARKNGTELTADQKAQLKASRELQRSKMESLHQQILAVLTPEQKAQLDAKQKEREQRFQNRKQFRRQDKTTTDKPTDKPIDN
jgi:protein CpxP